LHAEIVVRAAFDIGSNKVKSKVAEVDVHEGKILKILYQETFPIDFFEFLKGEKNLDLIKDCKSFVALEELKNKILPFHPQGIIGVATAAYRNSSFGRETISSLSQGLGFPIFTIDQTIEGILGFNSVMQAARLYSNEVIVLDIGGGSFQVTRKKNDQIFVFGSTIGRKHVLERLNKITLKDKTYKEIYESIRQEIQLNLGVLPCELKNAIVQSNHVVIGIGAYPKIEELKDGVWDCTLINQLCEKEFNQADRSNQNCADLMLLLSIMEIFQIKKIERYFCPGNADGLLVHEEYWTEY
jgi:exopolyphosphatase/pppGpp-phosphohydrolase